MGNFLVAFDASGVNVAIPSIGAALHATTVERQWILDGYTVPLCAFLLIAGQVGDRIGGTRLFKVSTALFAVASVLCAVAPVAGALIASRVLQGAAAGFMLPLTLSIISRRITDPAGRTRAIGLWGVVGGIAIASAPLLSGAITAGLGWRALFLINVPLCLLAIIGLPGADDAEPDSRRIDVIAQVLFCVTLGALAASLIEFGHEQSVLVVGGSSAVCVIAGALLVAHVRRTPDNVVPINTLTKPFALTVAGGGCYQFAAYGSLVVLPVYLQFARGYSVFEAGLLLLPCCGCWLIGNLVAMATSHSRHGILLRIFPLVGAMAAVAVGVLSDQHLEMALIASCGIGLSAGILASTLSSTAMKVATPGASGTSSAVLNVGRQTGMVIAIAILATDALTRSPSAAFGLIAIVFVGMWISCTAALSSQTRRDRAATNHDATDDKIADVRPRSQEAACQ